jgi:hypothetical protein
MDPGGTGAAQTLLSTSAESGQADSGRRIADATPRQDDIEADE